MNFINLKKYVTLIVIVAFAFSACKKIKTPEPMGDAGQTLVKLLGGGTPAEISKKPIDFVPTPTRIVAVEVRRDVPNNTELNKTMVVTVKDDTAAVRLAGYLHLNPAWFSSQVDDGVKTGGQGGTWTITLKPGQFSKTIFVTIPNATLLDPSSLYGLGFTLLTADAGGIVSAQKSLVVEIGAKNIYDGIYSVESGFVQRYSGPGSTNPICCDGLTGPLGPTTNPDLFLITIGANANVFGPGVGLTWSNGGGIGGIDGLRLSVDPATNLTSMSSTLNLTLTNWAGYPNNYNPATKTFTLNFRWNPTANTREYSVIIKYKGPR